MAIEVYRVGATGGRWRYETERVTVEVVGDGTVRLKFKVSSKGGGDTVVSVRIDQESFSQITETMVIVDREAAIKAFVSAMLLEPDE